LQDAGSAMAVDLAAATHKGHVRSNNEDHYLVVRFRRTLENVYSNLNKGMLASSYDLMGYGLLVQMVWEAWRLARLPAGPL